MAKELPRLVVIGGGFAGIELIQRLDPSLFRILLIDQNNYHTFQPLLYQVATGGLEASSIAYPLRKIFQRLPNFAFRMARVVSIDTVKQVVHTEVGGFIYDYLVIASGTVANFFHNEQVETYSLPLKSVANAIDIRSNLLWSLESSLWAKSEEERQARITFVIAGGGPTGVELAGALSELRRHVVPRDYPELPIEAVRIVLVNGGNRLLEEMSETSSAAALQVLTRMGVEVVLDTQVQSYDGIHVHLSSVADIASENMIWAAGVTGNPIEGLPQEIVDGKHHRIKVDGVNQVRGLMRVFAIGDVALMESSAYPHGHPQLAPVAKQQGQQLARNLARLQTQVPLVPFRYRDRGSLATIGRNRAIFEWHSIRLCGFFAWLLWSVVHIFYLVGFRNRLVTIFDWAWYYFTYDRTVRLILRPVQRRRVRRSQEERNAA